MRALYSFDQYIPILRWKAAEVDALLNLKGDVRKLVTPLLELCPTMFIKKKKVEKRLIKEILPIKTVSKKLTQLKGTIGSSPVYMDLIHINDDRSPYSNQSLWDAIINHGKLIKLAVIPVTGFYGKGISYQHLISSVATEFGNGACVRLFLRDISRPSFHSNMDKLLSMLNLKPSEVDLVIDFQVLNEQSPSYATIEQKLPVLDKWRSITFVAGSFPKDLGYPMKANNTYEIPRQEWLKWKKEILSDNSSISRVPRFGDFTIQHAVYIEPVDFPSVSASIRYVHDDYWIVLRGEALGKEGGIGNGQYPAEAQLIVSKKEYPGPEFSHGDEIIMQKSKDGSKPGTPEQWLMVGINHHITYTVYQIHPELLIKKQKEGTLTPEMEKETVLSLI